VKQRLFPCGHTRREFVWQMGGGFAGLALSSLLGTDDFFQRHLGASESKSALEPRDGHFPVKAKHVIFLMMNGAPSQVDTFDYKPEL